MKAKGWKKEDKQPAIAGSLNLIASHLLCHRNCSIKKEESDEDTERLGTRKQLPTMASFKALYSIVTAMGCFSFLYLKVLFFIRSLVDVLSGYILSFRCGRTTPLPPIQHPFLLMPAHQLAAQVRRQQIKCEDLVQVYINRIMQVNPILNAVVGQRFELALMEARAVDRLVASGEKSEAELATEKPFLGVPVTVKEHVGVKDQPVTLGILARKDIKAQEDSEAVRLLTKAGAIVIAVTNTPELCIDWADCINPVYGRTVNAYDTTRVAGGSSGGEGALLGAAGSVIGIGSDLGGSIRFPAMFNGVFGHKPTAVVISQEGVTPKLEGPLVNYLTLGPMCRYASDLRPMLKVMAGENAHRLRLDEKVSLKDLKFYYMEDIGGLPIVSPVDRQIKEAHQRAIKYLENTYGIQVNKVHVKTLKNSLYIIINSLWKQSNYRIEEVAVNFQGKMNFYVEFAKWFFYLSPRTLSFLVVTLLEAILPRPGKAIVSAVKRMRTALHHEMESLLGTDGVFLYPTHPTTAIYHSQGFLQSLNFIYCGIFNILGFPATHCTLGLDSHGLPLGIQVVSLQHNDRFCLAVAEELERGFGGWISPPSGRPTTTDHANGYKLA